MSRLLQAKIALNHQIIAGANLLRRMSVFRLSRAQKEVLARLHSKWVGSSTGKKVLLCGNGPSLNELEFLDYKSVKSCAVNFFYKHEKADDLAPQFYFIVDNKLAEGTWPISMLDEILEKFPGVEIFLNVAWLELPKFQPYRSHQQVNWILPSLIPHQGMSRTRRLDRSIYNLNVVVSALSVFTAMGFRKIAIAGVDGDGLFREILDQQSHFYDGDKDASMGSFTSMVESLYMSTHTLRAWEGWVRNLKSEGIVVGNVCRGGIMDCMPRWDKDEFLK